MKEILIIILSAVFVENFVLTKFLGICPFVGVSKRLNTAIGMGGAVIFVMTLSSVITKLVYDFLLKPLSWNILRPLHLYLLLHLWFSLWRLC